MAKAFQNATLLHNVYLFNDLVDSELEAVAEMAKQESFNQGDEIFNEGDAALALYVIKYGSVRIQHSGKSNSIDVATLGSGSHFGEMAFVDGENRSATVIALEKTDILRIEFSDLKTVLLANPMIAVKVYKSLAHFLCGRLRITTTDLSFAREKNIRHF